MIVCKNLFISILVCMSFSLLASFVRFSFIIIAGYKNFAILLLSSVIFLIPIITDVYKIFLNNIYKTFILPCSIRWSLYTYLITSMSSLTFLKKVRLKWLDHKLPRTYPSKLIYTLVFHDNTYRYLSSLLPYFINHFLALYSQKYVFTSYQRYILLPHTTLSLDKLLTYTIYRVYSQHLTRAHICTHIIYF